MKALLVICILVGANAFTHNILDFGAVPFEKSENISNVKALNLAFAACKVCKAVEFFAIIIAVSLMHSSTHSITISLSSFTNQCNHYFLQLSLQSH